MDKKDKNILKRKIAFVIILVVAVLQLLMNNWGAGLTLIGASILVIKD